MTVDRDRMWRDVFEPGRPVEAAEILALHQDAGALTRQLTKDVSAARVVAVANAMFNPCRPDRLSRTGKAASDEAWRILLDRKDEPYKQVGCKWDRLVKALEPIPEWAVKRLQRMDITQIGSVSQALIRGPYKEM